MVVPAFGQVQGEVAAAVAGGAGRDVDEVAADGGAAGPGVGELARAPAARSRLQLMAAQASHAALAAKEPDGRWARGPSFQSAKTCSMMAWSRWCSSAWIVCERAVGEHGVVAPGREQLGLPVSGFGVHVADPADDQPGGERGRGLAPAAVDGERGVFHLGDLGVGDPAAQLVIPQRPGIGDRRPGRGGIAAIAALTGRFSCAVTEKHAPARRTAQMAARL